METIGFFEEAPGKKSSVRLNSFLLLLFFMAYNLPFAFANAKAVVIGSPTASFDPNYLGFNILVLCFIFAPKVAQKYIELKFESKP
jgi:hypothetical protein